jgi:hypothetical protein
MKTIYKLFYLKFNFSMQASSDDEEKDIIKETEIEEKKINTEFENFDYSIIRNRKTGEFLGEKIKPCTLKTKRNKTTNNIS